MTEPILKYLKKLPLFHMVGDVGVEAIAPQLRWHDWRQRQTVMRPEETLNRYYVVLAGRVKISAQNPSNGRELILQLLRAGDGHNLIPLLYGKPHHVQATTLGSVKAVSAPVSSWRQWLDNYPLLRRFLLRYASERLQDLVLLASDLALYDTSTRLAHLLLRYLDDTGSANDHPLDDLVHEEIAQLIGSVRVVVNRLLNRFKREGIIHTAAGTLRVTDIERLLEKAEARFAHQFSEHRGRDPKPPSD